MSKIKPTLRKIKDIGYGLQSLVAFITTDFSLVQESLYLKGRFLS